MAVIVKDSFSKPNPSSLGIAETGQAWTSIDSSWAVMSGEARHMSGNDGIAVVNSGVSDCVISVKPTNKTSGRGIFFRQNNSTAPTGFHLQHENDYGIVVYQVPGYTELGKCPEQSYTTMKVELKGTSIKVYLDDVLKISTSSNYNLTATRHGLGTWLTGASFDDFLVEDFNTGGTGQTFKVDLSDAITATDSRTNRVNILKSDSLALSDSNTKSINKLKSDSITLSDTFTKAKKIVLTLLDTVSTTETFADNTALFKQLADSITPSDTLSKAVRIKKVLTDSLTQTDSITAQYIPYTPDAQHYQKTLTDAITFTDKLIKLLSKTVNDTVNLSDSKSKNISKLKQDTVTLSDSISKRLSVTIIDSINLRDNAQANIGGRGVALSDNILITDAIVKKVISRFKTDAVALSDDDQQASAKRLLDSITATDTVTTQKGKAIILSDSITVTDAISKAVKTLKTDNITLSDNASRQAITSLRLYDVVVTTDSLSVHIPNAPDLIGTIKLKGDISLNVYLVGKQELDINLQGKQSLNVHLKGLI
jgi:hypothetical protein